MSEILDCGHAPTVRGSLGTGYATVRATGERICYECAESREREDMSRATTYGAYLSVDGRTVQTWTGGDLAKVVGLTRGRRTNYGRMTYATATTPDGRVWRGSNGEGEGCALTMRTRTAPEERAS